MFVRFVVSPHRAARLALVLLAVARQRGAGSRRLHRVLRRRHDAAASIQPTVDDVPHSHRRRQQRQRRRTDRRRPPRNQLGRRRRHDGRGQRLDALGASPTPAAARSPRPARAFCKRRSTSPSSPASTPATRRTFTAFSRVRIFTPTGSNVTDVTFSLPGIAGARRPPSPPSARCSPTSTWRQHDQDRVLRSGQRLAVRCSTCRQRRPRHSPNGRCRSPAPWPTPANRSPGSDHHRQSGPRTCRTPTATPSTSSSWTTSSTPSRSLSPSRPPLCWPRWRSPPPHEPDVVIAEPARCLKA